MGISEADRGVIRAQVARLRTRLEAGDGPVHLPAAFEELSLKGPFDLFDDHFTEYLEYRHARGNPPNLVDQIEQVIGGIIDPGTREVFVNLGLHPPRRNFVIAHELMHAYLGHFDLLLLPEVALRRRRGEMELEASFAGVELLCPAELMKRRTQDSTPLGSRPGLTEIKRVAEEFDITYFTAVRHYVCEVATFPTALVSFRLSRQGGSGHVRLSGYKNRAWVENELPVVPVDLAFDIDSDPIGWRAHALLEHRRDPAYLADVREHVEHRFRCEAELLTTSESIYALLHGPVT